LYIIKLVKPGERPDVGKYFSATDLWMSQINYQKN